MMSDDQSPDFVPYHLYPQHHHTHHHPCPHNPYNWDQYHLEYCSLRGAVMDGNQTPSQPHPPPSLHHIHYPSENVIANEILYGFGMVVESQGLV